MVTPSKDKNLASIRPCHCGSDSHHICFRTRICKPDDLHCRREPLADHFGKLLFIDVVPTKTPPSSESLIDCSTDGSIVMSVDTGSIFAEEVSVSVTVERSEGASIAGSKGYGKRVGMEDSPGISSRLMLAC